MPSHAIGSALFSAARELAGPLHRRRRAFSEDHKASSPPLPPPWDDERWFGGGFAVPHAHNRLEPLIDGEQYLGDLFDVLTAARSRVTICGWCLTPLMPLLRGARQKESMLADVLHQVSSRAEVYVLLWAGAPALFEPTHRMVEEIRQTLQRIAPRVRCELDTTAPFSHDHHQKAVTVDGRIAYVGGMDLTTFQGDRWDTNDHELRFGYNWHDVQMRLEGEVVHDVERNFCQRWNAVTGGDLEPLAGPPPDAALDTPAQIVRTTPAGCYPFAPDGEFGIYHALTTAIRRARQFVYLENQYIWAPEIVDALAEAMQRSEELRVVLLLPARAYTGRYDNDEHVRDLTELGGHRFHAYCPYAGGPAIGSTGYRYHPIYVHAKVSIVDDEWFSAGSANLNRRGLATDSEMNVHSIAPGVASDLRIRLWAEHLGTCEKELEGTDPIELIDTAWPAAAAETERRMRAGDPPGPASVHRYVPGRNPPSRLLDIIQGATLEH